MAFEIRPVITAEDIVAFDQMQGLGFGDNPASELAAADRAVAENDRSLMAVEGDLPIGGTSAYSLRLSVPGSEIGRTVTAVPAAGISAVSVIPTHRRRGVMTTLLRRQLEDIHQAGDEALAVLWASQAAIYPRFGFGLATQSVSIDVPRALSLMRPAHDAQLRLELVESKDDRSLSQPVYDAVTASRPGVADILSDAWFARLTHDPKPGEEVSPLSTIVASDGNGPRGYARFNYEHDWSRGFGDGTVRVRDLLSIDPAAHAALWEFLLGLEMMTTISQWNVPTDDPIFSWISEPRRVNYRLRDQLFMRLVDLPRALGARGYRTDLDVIVDVRDAFCPWNAGRWQLALNRDGGACTKTSRSADVSLDVVDLGAAYLGGTSFDQLARAGWVDEHTPGSIARMSLAFGNEPAPWCPFVF
jgi:predicted acetyltransferase